MKCLCGMLDLRFAPKVRNRNKKKTIDDRAHTHHYIEFYLYHIIGNFRRHWKVLTSVERDQKASSHSSRSPTSRVPVALITSRCRIDFRGPSCHLLPSHRLSIATPPRPFYKDLYLSEFCRPAAAGSHSREPHL